MLGSHLTNHMKGFQDGYSEGLKEGRVDGVTLQVIKLKGRIVELEAVING